MKCPGDSYMYTRSASIGQERGVSVHLDLCSGKEGEDFTGIGVLGSQI